MWKSKACCNCFLFSCCLSHIFHLIFSPRALPAAPSTEAPRGMRAGIVPPTPCLQSTPPLWDPTKDLRAIASNFCYLENSGTVWKEFHFYSHWAQQRRLLKSHKLFQVLFGTWFYFFFVVWYLAGLLNCGSIHCYLTVLSD